MAKQKAKFAVPGCIVLYPFGLNVRSAPGLDQPVVRVAKKGETLEAICPVTGGWLPVRGGWVVADYAAVPPELQEQPEGQEE